MVVLYILLAVLVLYCATTSLLVGAMAMNLSDKKDQIEDYQKVLSSMLTPYDEENK